MIKECQKIFENNIKKHGDRFLFDNLTIQDGSYVLVTIKDNCFNYEVVDVKYSKKNNEIETNNALKIPQLTKLNYYSELIDINKPVDGKKVIHSNGIYSFFVKKDSINSGKLTEDIIKNYYKILEDPVQYKYKNDKKKTELFEKVNASIKSQHKERDSYNKENIDRIQKWILENIDKIEGVDYTKKDYLKIFFLDEDNSDFTELNFELECKKYQIPNIYNKNDYNELIDDVIYGLSNNNMGMNSKKPFLEHKTRKTKVSNLVDENSIFLEKKMFDYLYGVASKGMNILFFDKNEDNIIAIKDGEFPGSDLSGYFMYVRKGKEPEILDFDVISNYTYELKRSFYSKQIIDTSYKGTSDVLYGEIKDKAKLFTLLDNVIFRKYLKYNMFTPIDEIRIQNANIKKIVLNCRRIIFRWLYQDNISGLSKLLKHLEISIKNNIFDNYITVAKDQFNLYISILDYLNNNKEGMHESMENVKERFKDHLLQEEDWQFTDDQEYYFAMGQSLFYLMNLSNSRNKDMSFVKQILNAKSDENFKRIIMRLHSRYSHAIQMHHKRINKAVANILLYNPEGELDTKMLYAAFLDNNLFYVKKDKKEEEKENSYE